MLFISLLEQNGKPVETKRHLSTRFEEHLGKDRKSHIYSPLQENPHCQEKISFDCFEIIDCASSYFRLKIRKAMHINCKNPNSTNKLSTYVLLFRYRSIIVSLSSHFL